jgi:hypothetical protein
MALTALCLGLFFSVVGDLCAGTKFARLSVACVLIFLAGWNS